MPQIAPVAAPMPVAWVGVVTAELAVRTFDDDGAARQLDDQISLQLMEFDHYRLGGAFVGIADDDQLSHGRGLAGE